MEQATPFTTFLTWMAEALNRFHVSDVFCELIAPMTKPAEIELTVEAIEYGETAAVAATGQGTFRVGRCSKWRPRRVSASPVTTQAADGRGREFVSRSICTPTETSAHGKASRWRCTVVHNNWSASAPLRAGISGSNSVGRSASTGSMSATRAVFRSRRGACM